MRREQAEAFAVGLAILFIPVAVALTIGVKVYGYWRTPDPVYGYDSQSFYADNN